MQSSPSFLPLYPSRLRLQIATQALRLLQCILYSLANPLYLHDLCLWKNVYILHHASDAEILRETNMAIWRREMKSAKLNRRGLHKIEYNYYPAIKRIQNHERFSASDFTSIFMSENYGLAQSCTLKASSKWVFIFHLLLINFRTLPTTERSYFFKIASFPRRQSEL